MRTRFFVALAAAGLCALPGSARPKPSASCRAYVIVMEHDEVTVGLSMIGLNKPQLSWYKKHGDKGKYAGVCPLNPPGSGQQAVDALPLNPPKGMNSALPTYAIVWGEHLVSQPYTYGYTTGQHSTGTYNGTITDDSGNTANVHGTTTTTVPVQHNQSGVKRYYVADGILLIWKSSANGGKGDFVSIRPLHNQNRTILTSASTSLLKDGFEQIADMNKLADDRF
jgi:hypothetical protein